MKKLPHWTKLPSHWIEAGGLKEFRWLSGSGADNTAALMALTVICHHIDSDTGRAQLTYNALCEKCHLSRAKLSNGLSILANHLIIDRHVGGRSNYGLIKYNSAEGWAKFPARGLYQNDVVTAFTEFRLRLRAELDALKLYFLFASRRDRRTNSAKITYQKIEEYSGVSRDHIRRALSVLTANGLVHVQTVASEAYESGIANSYRLAHLDSYTHMGTTGRTGDIL